MEGLNGVILVQSIHYFPFILINLSASLRNIDRSMEESAQNLGAHGLRLFRRIVFPLAMPGYVAGAALVFIKVFDDLGTPLLLNVNNMLAPAGLSADHLDRHHRPDGLCHLGHPGRFFAAVALGLVPGACAAATTPPSRRAAAGCRGATSGRGRRSLRLRRRRLDPAAGAVAASRAAAAVVRHHLVLRAAADAYTLAHYVRMFGEARAYITNTLLYAGLAALLDVILGTAIAYIVLRTRIAGRKVLDYWPRPRWRFPAWCSASATCAPSTSFEVPFIDKPLASWWVIIAIALMIRRLPYALRACMAALQQVALALEEAAENLGATKFRTIRRIVVPLMAGGILAGFVTSFATAAVELSATIMLVSSERGCAAGLSASTCSCRSPRAVAPVRRWA